MYLIQAAVLQLALQIVTLGMKAWDHAAWHVRWRRLHVAQMRPVLAAGIQVQVQNRAVLRDFEVGHIEVPVSNRYHYEQSSRVLKPAQSILLA